MEFLTTKQKKLKARRLFIAYGLLSVLVMLATYVLISTALGFDVFRGKEIVQNGLLFIDSRPDNAEVYINGKKESNATNAKYSLPESSYDIKLTKNGYRDWNGNVEVIGGTVEFLTYPRLLPNSPALIASQTHQSMPAFAQSRDKRWLGSVVNESPEQIVVYDLDNPQDLIRSISLPAQFVAGKKVSSTKIVEWAGDNEHILVCVGFQNVAENSYILINRDKPQEYIDISAIFPLAAGDNLGLWNGKKDEIFIKRANGIVFLGNIKDKALVAQGLVGDVVLQFEAISDERALYTTKLGEELQIKLYSKDKTYVITSIPYSTEKVILRGFGYNRNDYILVAGKQFDKTYVFRNFEKSIEKSIQPRLAPFLLLPINSTYADLSRGNRFVMGTDGVTSVVYDLEQKELHKYELPVPRPAQLGWFDDVRLYALASDQTLSIMDFDGKNLQAIGASVLGLPYVNANVTKFAYQMVENGSIKTMFVDIDTPTVQ